MNISWEKYLREGNKNFFAEFMKLFWISFLGLFLEILLIRWLAAEVRLFGFFNNLCLIACFLGLGVGCTLARSEKKLEKYMCIGVCIFILIVLVSTKLSFIPYLGSEDESLWGFASSRDVSFQDYAKYFSPFESISNLIDSRYAVDFISALLFYGTVVFFFFTTAFVFLPIGKVIGKKMMIFQPLPAYSINILGSLAGIFTFCILSFLHVPPFFWFLIAIAIIFPFLQKESKRVYYFSLLITVVTLSFLFMIRDRAYWSPYYKITLRPTPCSNRSSGEGVPLGYLLNINNKSHMTIENLSREYFREFPECYKDEYKYNKYNLIYNLIQPKDVLIVGAGGGNDVAAALRNGVSHIDAVEIDPLIYNLGKTFHPEKPYDSSKVTVHINDARNYFKWEKSKKYDLIVFGLLDSHTLFSSMSSVRLDNFVYTLESFLEAKALLKEEGYIYLTYAISRDWIGDRIYRMLTEAFGQEPLILSDSAMVIGNNLDKDFLRKDPDLYDRFLEYSKTYHPDLLMATDDWPFLYLRENKIPDIYWISLLLLLLFTLFLLSRVFPIRKKIDLHFFFLGGAFLLLETRSITVLGLLLGSTWLVNSFVIGGILIMILIANYVVSIYGRRLIKASYFILGIVIGLNYFLAPLVLALGPTLSVWIMLLLVSLPLFFAGIIFAGSFKNVSSPDLAFGSNLLGAITGGFLEYSSLAWGFNFLLILALIFYLFSFVAGIRNFKGS